MHFVINHIEALTAFKNSFKNGGRGSPKHTAAATASLSTLILFCSESQDSDPLTRSGVPITKHQRLLLDTNVHSLVIHLLAAPFRESQGPIASYSLADLEVWGWSLPPPPPAHPQRTQVSAGVGKPPHGLGVCVWMPLVNGTGNSPSPGRPTPGVVKQDKSSGGSVDTTKTRSGPQRVRMSSGERPIGAAKGKQSDIQALCQPPPPPSAGRRGLPLPLGAVKTNPAVPVPSPGGERRHAGLLFDTSAPGPPPPLKRLCQIVFRAFGQSKILSGAFVRTKGFLPRLSHSSTTGGGGWVGPPPPSWAPLTHKRHIPPHSAQPRHTNDWAPRTRKRHQREHRPQRPTERSNPTQHAKGRTGDCPGPRKETTTGRNVTRGGGGGPCM